MKSNYFLPKKESVKTVVADLLPKNKSGHIEGKFGTLERVTDKVCRDFDLFKQISMIAELKQTDPEAYKKNLSILEHYFSEE